MVSHDLPRYVKFVSMMHIEAVDDEYYNDEYYRQHKGVDVDEFVNCLYACFLF